MEVIKNYINGKKINYSNEFLDVYDPSTGEIISKVVLSNNEDFSKTVESSFNAQKQWSQVTPLKRSRIISNYKVLIQENIEELAKIVSESMEKH